MQQHVVTGQSASLVKAADLHLASKGDAEGLCAEDGLAPESNEGVVDGHGELHGQLWGDDGRDDHGAVEVQLEAAALLWRLLQALVQHIPCKDDLFFSFKNILETYDAFGEKTFRT